MFWSYLAFCSLENALSYHLIEAGAYRIQVTNGEKIYFNVKNNGVTNVLAASLFITNYVNLDIVDPFFNITFTTGAPGDSITEKIEVAAV